MSVDGKGLFFSSPYTWAIGFFPAPMYETTPYIGAAGDVYLNIQSEANYLRSYEPGSQGWFLMIHELGHAMGLKHTHDDGGTGRPTFDQLGVDYLDQDFVSIMSYNDETAWNRFSWDPATPMAADVLGLQYLYGKNEVTNAGNTVHEITRTGMFYTLWDPSGSDTVDLSESSEGWNLVLPSYKLDPTYGMWSEVDGRVGFANPMSQMSASTPTEFVWLLGQYENVIGSDHADQISAEFYDDRETYKVVPRTIVGSKGNDYILGTKDDNYGNNTVVYQGKLGDYKVTGIDYDPGRMDPGRVVVTGPNGVDVLEGIQKIKFSDFSLGFGHHSRVGQIYRYVKAAFGPNVSADEIGRWLEVDAKMESPYLTSLEILASDTFHQKYGDGQSNESYIREFFKNLRGREITQTELNDQLQLINGYGLPTLFSNLTVWSTDLYLTRNEYEDGVRFLDAQTGLYIVDSSLSSDTYIGTNQVDTVVFSGKSSDFVRDFHYSHTAIENVNTSDKLVNIERLKFSNTSVALDLEGNAGEAYRIYKAAFDRVPDKSGLGYWINDMDKGRTLTNVAAGFIASEEFQSRYGAAVSDEGFITLLYENVLNRTPDQAGLDYWISDFKNGLSRAAALASFSESAENKANVAGLISTGIEYTPFIG